MSMMWPWRRTVLGSMHTSPPTDAKSSRATQPRCRVRLLVQTHVGVGPSNATPGQQTPTKCFGSKARWTTRPSASADAIVPMRQHRRRVGVLPRELSRQVRRTPLTARPGEEFRTRRSTALQSRALPEAPIVLPISETRAPLPPAGGCPPRLLPSSLAFLAPHP